MPYWIVLLVLIGLTGCIEDRTSNADRRPQSDPFHLVVDEDSEVFHFLPGFGSGNTFQLASPPKKGTLVVNQERGTLRYVPMPDENGEDSFKYRLSNGSRDSALSTITVDILPVDDAPRGVSSSIVVTEDTPFTTTLTGQDVDSSILNFSLASNGTQGTATINNAQTGSFTYVPKANATGADSFTFLVDDGNRVSSLATITVNISNVNDAPTAAPRTLSLKEDETVRAMLTATDVDSAALTYSIVSNATKGVATVIDAATGEFTYVPNLNANGADSFSYRVSDGALESIATVTLDITPVNDLPVTTASPRTVLEDRVLNGQLQASDVDGDALTFSLDTNVSTGTLSLLPNGDFTYTPQANRSGSDVFTYRVGDGTGFSQPATVFITIQPENDAPVAGSAQISTLEERPVAGRLTASDPEGTALTYRVGSIGAKGTVRVTNSLTGDFIYTPYVDSRGSDSFTIIANDGALDSAPGAVTVEITPVVERPTPDLIAKWNYIDSLMEFTWTQSEQGWGQHAGKVFRIDTIVGGVSTGTATGLIPASSRGGHRFAVAVTAARLAELLQTYPGGRVPFSVTYNVLVPNSPSLVVFQRNDFITVSTKPNFHEYKVAVVQITDAGPDLETVNACLAHNSITDGSSAYVPINKAVPDCERYDFGAQKAAIDIRSYPVMQLLVGDATSTRVTNITTGQDRNEDYPGDIEIRSLKSLGLYWEKMLADHDIVEVARLGRSPRFRVDVLPVLYATTKPVGDNTAVTDYFATVEKGADLDLSSYDYVVHVFYRREFYDGNDFRRSFAAGSSSYVAASFVNEVIFSNAIFLTTAHEMGHQIFQLPDRYDGFGIKYPSGVPHPTQFPQTKACLMTQSFGKEKTSDTLASAYSTNDYNEELKARGFDRFYTQNPDNYVLCVEDVIKLKGVNPNCSAQDYYMGLCGQSCFVTNYGTCTR